MVPDLKLTPRSLEGYGTGVVVASIELKNCTIFARSAAFVSVSTPPVPALRCVTFASTWSSEAADPL
jgi:hypothetical protein